ncbi:phosphatidylserine decarboxylase family protein [Candidatus Woesearchaeota archaeon]|nr:phosphatidylserine decarboxylase family protein [Candidatus Woesearchaeota archaeon]
MLIPLVIIATAIGFYLFFHRDPARLIPLGSNIVSPADGIIGQIIDVDHEAVIDKGLLGQIKALCTDISPHCVLIQIIMRPWDVHVQRSPITGIVDVVTYVPGKFSNALMNKTQRIVENEHNEVTIRNKGIKIKVIQIAGAMARRIRCFVALGNKVLKGSRIGAIRLGSQVCVIFPRDKIHVVVHKGEKVYAGQSIIGTYQDQA